MAIETVSINDDPQQALDKINHHCHDGGCGEQIPSTGIADGAVTAGKIADGAVTAGKIADGAVTKRKIGPDVNFGINMLARSTVYAAGDVAYSASLPSWARLECVTAGTTAATEPAEFASVSTGGGTSS